MRTTVDLPDLLFRAAKARAAHRGVPLKALVTEALEKELLKAPQPGGKRPKRVDLPLIRSKHPGRLKLTNAQIEAILSGPG